MEDACYFCGCDFATLRTLPGMIIVRVCDECHREVLLHALGGVPVVEVVREVSAAIDALAAW